jgi:SpoVK/Ycf46/Vps4 family AAA+-type ATPase
MQGVTNELLKIIPAFREQPGRLLVCATNFIRALDSALLRHGRFDYVIPIGLPDEAARQAIWERYVPQSMAEQVDLATLVAASEGFSPADIEYAARRASQQALERALFSADAAPVDGLPAEPAPAGPTTADYVAAIQSTRTTVSAQVAAEFLEDIESLARL